MGVMPAIMYILNKDRTLSRFLSYFDAETINILALYYIIYDVTQFTFIFNFIGQITLLAKCLGSTSMT
jgi:hypothetical protein